MQSEILRTAQTTLGEGPAWDANDRFDDGKCDLQGRFLAGGMSVDEKTPSGAHGSG